MAVISAGPKTVSRLPQLIEMTPGEAWIAVVIASIQPRSSLGAKYTRIDAPGAIDPATSISSITSPSADFGLPTGELVAPLMERGSTYGVGRPTPEKYAS